MKTKKVFVVAVGVLLAVASGSLAAEQTLALTSGFGVSNNLGEKKVAPALHAEFASAGAGRWGVEAGSLYDSADKYTRGGWLSKSSITTSFGKKFFALGGANFTYRDGLGWTKKTLFVHAGGGVELYHPSSVKHHLRLLGSTEVAGSRDSRNRLRYMQLVYRVENPFWEKSRWNIRGEIAPTAVSFLKSDGSGPRDTQWHVYLWLGVALRL